ncbi:hypothetical protein MKX03_027953 [Papaver bracteatum]|nr:hypothetical protein MKX03_027953 [Papaver bracteatum]
MGTSSEPAKIEQIITEFFAKSLHIILESRTQPCSSSRNNYSGEQTLLSSPSSSSSSSSSVRPRDKWFNLALRECPASLENLELWHQSNLEPMVVDVLLFQRGPVNFHDDGAEMMKKDKVIERWVVKYETRKSGRDFGHGGNKRNPPSATSHSLYKKSIILLRSLYLTVRILPAHKLFHELNSSGQILTYGLAHRVSTLVEPFTRREEVEMKEFVFTPVDTTCGRLCLSVLYSPALSDVNSEPSTPVSPQFIPDYVGSPTTDRLKSFPSLPLARFRSHEIPSSVPFERRHSWSYDSYGSSAPPVSGFPSPAYSDSRGFSYNPSSHRLPPLSIPSHQSETPRSSNASLATRNTNFDDFWPSPMPSPTPSPSPPAHLKSKALLRSGSAPVSIPTTGNPAMRNIHLATPSPPRGTKMGPSQSSNGRNLTRAGDVNPTLKYEKMNSFGKDEVGNISGAKASSGISPRISFSRSSSRFSSQDMFDYSDFACPFAVGDDITDPRPGPDLSDGKAHHTDPRGQVRKSQDAAVGALVEMLSTAPPLRQDISKSIKLSQVSEPEIWGRNAEEPAVTLKYGAGGLSNSSCNVNITTSGLLLSKTTADALEEFQSYRQLKESLLLRNGNDGTSTNAGHASETADKS